VHLHSASVIVHFAVHLHSASMIMHFTVHLHSAGMIVHFAVHLHSAGMIVHFAVHLHSAGMIVHFAVHLHSASLHVGRVLRTIPSDQSVCLCASTTHPLCQLVHCSLPRAKKAPIPAIAMLGQELVISYTYTPAVPPGLVSITPTHAYYHTPIFDNGGSPPAHLLTFSSPSGVHSSRF